MDNNREYLFSWKLESFKHTINSGRLAMQNGVLLNGGAAVALMTFLGHAFTGNSFENQIDLTRSIASLMLFGLGAFSGAAAFGATYYSQGAFTDFEFADSQKTGKFWMRITVTAVVISYLSFIGGLCLAGLSLL